MSRTLFNRQLLCITLLGALVQTSCLAKGAVSLNAHVHGVSELTIALEKQQLEIELRSPAINLFGFEHSAITTSDKTVVNKAKLLLEKQHELFSFSGGDCVLVNKFTDVSSVIHSQQIKTLQDINVHNHNDKHGDHDDHDDHQNKHTMNDNVKHHEVVAKYNFRCKTPLTLSTVKVKLFEFFSGIEQIKVMWLTEFQQGASVLNTNNRSIRLKVK